MPFFMTRDTIITYDSRSEATAAFINDLKAHRETIEVIFERFGAKLCEIAGADYDDVQERILRHDLSKCNNADEYRGFTAFLYPSKDDGIIDGQRKLLYEKALLTHYHNNKDHPEFWLYIEDDQCMAVQMEPEAVVEMVCDWEATSNDNDMLPTKEFWNVKRCTKLINDATVELIDELVDYIDDNL